MDKKINYFSFSGIIGGLIYFIFGVNFIFILIGISILAILSWVIKSITKWDALVILCGYIAGIIAVEIIGIVIFWGLVIIVSANFAIAFMINDS